MYGLIARDFHYIHKALQAFPEIESAKIFGSRALGHYKKGSDVDLAIIGDEITHKTLIRLSDALNEVYPLPYMFDVVDYRTISNENLRDHIHQFGAEIYQRNRHTDTCSSRDRL